MTLKAVYYLNLVRRVKLAPTHLNTLLVFFFLQQYVIHLPRAVTFFFSFHVCRQEASLFFFYFLAVGVQLLRVAGWDSIYQIQMSWSSCA